MKSPKRYARSGLKGKVYNDDTIGLLNLPFVLSFSTIHVVTCDHFSLIVILKMLFPWYVSHNVTGQCTNFMLETMRAFYPTALIIRRFVV